MQLCIFTACGSVLSLAALGGCGVGFGGKLHESPLRSDPRSGDENV